MTIEAFQFLPGEKVMWIIGQPGPDTDDCQVISQDGPNVTIEFQVFGQGPLHTKTIDWSQICWMRGSETSKRFAAWKSSL